MYIREATPDDGGALQALQAQCPMGASLVISTVNTPDFFSRAKAYAWYKVYVACEGDEIIGSAACATHPALLQGQAIKVGYEFQYFVSPQHRRRGVGRALHTQIEATLRAEGAALIQLVAIEGNIPSMRLFESVGFEPVQTLVMPGLIPYKVMPEPEGPGVIRPARPEDFPAILALRDVVWGQDALYEPLSESNLAQQIERMPAYSLDDVWVLEADGEILGCFGAWDWSQITRIEVQALSWKLQWIGLGLTVGGWFARLPQGVKVGDVLKQVVLTPFAWKDLSALNYLLRWVNNDCVRRGVGQVFCVVAPGHPLLANLKGFIHIDTQVHVYVKMLQERPWPGTVPLYLDGRDL